MTGQQSMFTFMNPVIRGFNPDPTICVVPGDAEEPTKYFLSTSTFEYFPGCTIYKSTDLINWELIGHALNRKSQISLRTVEPGAGSWASTLRYRVNENRFYLVNGVFHRYRPAADERIFPRGFYIYTDNIEDENAWSDPIFFDNPGFDQDLFWDDATSKVYLSTTHRLAVRPPNSKQKDFAIHISEIDLPTGRTLTPPKVIRQSELGLAEGSHILKRGRWYYLFTAEGGTETGHQEWVFRSAEGPLGPWEGMGQPLWYNSPDEEVQRTGHADVFEDSHGEWWAVLLGVRPIRHGGIWLEPQLGRETFLVKVTWVNDWPVFNDGNNITLLTSGRHHVIQNPDPCIWKASLDQLELELGWYQKNTPTKTCYSLTERPGYLRLHGGCYELSSPESPSMLLRKQCSYNEIFEAKMIFQPHRTGYEAGLVLWWNQFSYATIGITQGRQNGRSGKAIIWQAPAGESGEQIVPQSDPFSIGSQSSQCDEVAHLKVLCGTEDYVLSISVGSSQHDFKIQAESLTVAPPVGGAFAGMMYGVYSFGKGEPVLDAADFYDIMITKTTAIVDRSLD